VIHKIVVTIFSIFLQDN